jgi:YVTN family beta-propeller protein
VWRSIAGQFGPTVFDAGYIWATSLVVDAVAEIDPTSDSVLRTVPVGNGPAAITVGAGAVWVASHDGTVTRIDPATGGVVATIQVGGTPDAIAYGYGRIWVGVT